MTIHPAASKKYPVVCFQDNREPSTDSLPLIREAPLSIHINNQPFLHTTRTPVDDELLLTGILFAQGMISSAAQISGTQFRAGTDNQEGAIREDAVNLTVPELPSPIKPLDREVTDRKSKLLKAVKNPRNETFSFKKLSQLPEVMSTHQELYASSRAAHAVGLFNREGTLLTCQEDASRTHALHKALGFCLRHELAWGELIAVFSGRINFAIACTIARTGFPLVLSISAPTDSAVEVLSQAGVSYIGSLRNQRGVLYTPNSPLTIKK